MQNAIAFCDNDVITIAWSYGRRPDGCLGFALYRLDQAGIEAPLPSHAVFPGDTIKPGQTTDDFPVQKFYWKDPYARLIAEKTSHRRFRYKIVPVQGTPGHITPTKCRRVKVSTKSFSSIASSVISSAQQARCWNGITFSEIGHRIRIGNA